MTDRIVTRESIAKDADEAAQQYELALASNPKAARPANPWDEALHPDHHAEWAASFDRYWTARCRAQIHHDLEASA